MTTTRIELWRELQDLMDEGRLDHVVLGRRSRARRRVKRKRWLRRRLFHDDG